MYVTGYSNTFIAVLIGGNDFRWKVIKRDDELISALIKLETDFWKHVQDGTPPEIDGSDATAEYLAERYSGGNAEVVVLPEEAIELISEYSHAKEQIKAFTEKKQLAENRLKDMLGDNESGIIGSSTVKWKSVTQERLDTTRLKKELPDISDKYTTRSSYRKFTVKCQEE